MDKYYENDINSVISVTSILMSEINEVINIIFLLCGNSIEKIDNNIKLIYFNKLEKHIGEYAGAMDKDEFYTLYMKSKNNTLNITHIRKAYNAFWTLSSTIIPYIIFSGTSSEKSMLLNDFILNIKNGILNFDNFMKSIDVDIDKELLEVILLNGLYHIIDPNDNNRKITIDHFYKHVIKMMYIGTRYKSTIFKERDNSKCGYNNDVILSKYNKIKSYFSVEENNQIISNNKFPWSGIFINSVNKNSYYYEFCNNNKIYYVSGRSGSTFELMMLFLVLFPHYCWNRKLMNGLMMFFIHFHVIRGTHSILEVLLSFYDIVEYYIINKFRCASLESIIHSHIEGNAIIFSKSHICENIIFETKYDDILKYSLEEEKRYDYK